MIHYWSTLQWTGEVFSITEQQNDNKYVLQTSETSLVIYIISLEGDSLSHTRLLG
jgi:hypothetical protein